MQELIKHFNQYPVTFERPDAYTLVIKSQHSLFRLGVWLEGYISCYNSVFDTYTITLLERSKYYIRIAASNAGALD